MRFAVAAALVVLGGSSALGATSVRAQTLRGRVVDAADERALPGVEVVVYGTDEVVGRAVTDSVGVFSIRVPGSGTWWVGASALGYARSDSAAVEIERWWEQVEVVIRLAATPLEVEGLTVVAKGTDLRHLATYDGFLARHETALAVGSARVLSRDDPQMSSAFDVGDVMQWLPTERQKRCTVIYVDGKVNPGWSDVRDVAVESLAGIEFYVSFHDAPLEFRGGGPPCLRAADWTVSAVWRRRLDGG